MAKAKPSVVCWDSCIFIAYITDETRPPGEMEGLYTVAEEVHQGKKTLIASVEVFNEVLETNLAPEQNKRFESLFDRSNIQAISKDRNVAQKARELRDFYQQEKARDGRPGLCSPDATHLATAILYEADEFHTFDEHDSHGCRGLLGLSGNVGGHRLTICKPSTTQLGLL